MKQNEQNCIFYGEVPNQVGLKNPKIQSMTWHSFFLLLIYHIHHILWCLRYMVTRFLNDLKCEHLNLQGDTAHAHYNNQSNHEFTTPADEIPPMMPDEGLQISTIISGLMPDKFGEMFNFLDGDSFGIGGYQTVHKCNYLDQASEC